MRSWIVLAILMASATAAVEPMTAARPASIAQPCSVSEPRLRRPRLSAAPIAQPLAWHTNYAAALRRAKQQRRPLLLYFCDQRSNTACRQFESETLALRAVQQRLATCVLVRLPLGAISATGTSARKVLQHASLAEMHGMPGVAIIDFAHPLAPHYGFVVSQLPFQRKKYFQRDTFHGSKSLITLLDLPPGSLTQRTLIYAVRMQHESPRSTAGRMDADLTEDARKHSAHQASIQLQGHHNWDARFAEINQRLAEDLVPIEVCAESWPGENLLEAAVECVYSWRRSEGHWSGVSAYHPVYGYDMARGANGIWYATGIFGKLRPRAAR
jgi:hypothetical protein